MTAYSAGIRDSSSDHPAHVSHFGVLKSGPTVPVLKGNFPGSALDTKQWEEISINSASVTVADGMAQMQCGTNSAGSTKLKSMRVGKFEAGQVTVFQSGVRSGTGQADNTRIWGLMTDDEQDGLYFKLSGTTFQVVARKGGSETVVSSASFNGDGSFLPADKNTTYRIEYSAGRAIFYSASGGRKNLLHEMVDSSSPLVDDLDLGLYFENTNSGNTTNKSMYVRGASSSVWGSLDRYNEGNAHLVANFDQEVALDRVSRYEIGTKFGRNPDVDAVGGEDLWNGGSTYTGFNATGNENIEVFSSDVDDQGSLVSSGTATGGSKTTLIDSSATFVTDSVAAGDLLINDTKGQHGVIASVDSETQVTVHRMVGKVATTIRRNVPGDSYRIANANDTGAAVVKLTQILDDDYQIQTSKYAILNGTTGVTVTVDAMRCTRAQVILSGSSGHNEGTITARQVTSTSNVFAVMPAEYGQTTIGAFTVPAGRLMIIRRVRVSIARANGSDGSATVLILVRRRGESWRAIRAFEVQTGGPTDFTQLGGDIQEPGTDIKMQISRASDNNTIADGAFEYTLFEE